jgi:hypothetical protein
VGSGERVGTVVDQLGAGEHGGDPLDAGVGDVRGVGELGAADGLITRFAPGFNVGRYLEEVCQRWVAWETRRTSFRYESLTALAASSGRLAEDGVARAFTAMQRLVAGDMLARVDIVTTAPRDDRGIARRTIRLTGILVALARIAGETAPLLFTSFNNRFWSTSLTQPIGSLTVQVFTYAISPYEDWHRQAWAGAFVLVMIILILSIVARLVTRRLERMNRG